MVACSLRKIQREWRVIKEIVAFVIAGGSRKSDTCPRSCMRLSLPVFSAVYAKLSTQLIILWQKIATLASNLQKGQTQLHLLEEHQLRNA